LLTLHHVDLYDILVISAPHERVVVGFTADGDAGPPEGRELDVGRVDVWVFGDEVGCEVESEDGWVEDVWRGLGEDCWWRGRMGDVC
jgi:hypothetical protein